MTAPTRSAGGGSPGRDRLPVDEVLPEVLAALAAHRAAVLVAPPGAGKTTRLPPALLTDRALGGGRVVLLEPRRVAARAAARRIAAEQGWTVGREIGWQIRFERMFSAETRLLVVTEGILLRMLQSDPFLEGTAAVVFDELHERSLDADLSLALVRRVQEQVRPELVVVAMSATLAATPIAAFLGGAPVVESRGRLFPVAVEHLPAPEAAALPRGVAAAVRHALAAGGGDVLVFLPGVGEIERCRRALAPLAAEVGLAVVPLHGSLSGEAQDAALVPGASRRVVLATNVAETSITVPGVRAVVDSGLARVLRFDPSAGLDRLELTRISRASAEQRAGRAGREAPGLAIRLWSEHDHRGLAERETPEVARVDVSGAVLQLLAWGERPETFPWLEAPPASALAAARRLLSRLDLLDPSGLTPLGRRLARFPTQPRLARLLAAGHDAGHLEEAARLAALLAERDPFPRGEGPPPAAADSDLWPRLDALGDLARGRSPRETPYGQPGRGAARHVLAAAEQLAAAARRELGEPPPPRGTREEALTAALLAAFPDRLARRRADDPERAVLVGGRGLRRGRRSAVRGGDLFLALEVDGGRRGERSEAVVHLATAVPAEALPASHLEPVRSVSLDRDRDRVVATRSTLWLGELAVDEREVPATDAEAAAALVAAAADDLGRALPLGEDPAAGFLARVAFLRSHRPDLELPALAEDDFLALLPDLARGRRSLADLRSAPLLDLLRARLGWRACQLLDELAPERLEVPSGSRIRLAYDPSGRPPLLAVRIQELFGLADTPRVAAGRVPVLLHLLAPSGRPQQVTDDLAGFWRRGYPEVRRELRARYPRHAWPEDPAAAAPERRPGRRRPPGS